MNAEHSKRRKALLALVREHKLDALLVTDPPNWFYLTGFTGESGVLIVSDKGSTVITDGRFTAQARQETSGVKIELQQGPLYRFAGAFLQKIAPRCLGYDANQLSVTQLNMLRKATGSKWRGIPALGLVERLRMRKDAQELAMMRKAAVLAGEVLEGVLKLVKPGVREFELAAACRLHRNNRGLLSRVVD